MNPELQQIIKDYKLEDATIRIGRIKAYPAREGIEPSDSQIANLRSALEGNSVKGFVEVTQLDQTILLNKSGELEVPYTPAVVPQQAELFTDSILIGEGELASVETHNEDDVREAEEAEQFEEEIIEEQEVLDEPLFHEEENQETLEDEVLEDSLEVQDEYAVEEMEAQLEEAPDIDLNQVIELSDQDLERLAVLVELDDALLTPEEELLEQAEMQIQDEVEAVEPLSETESIIETIPEEISANDAYKEQYLDLLSLHPEMEGQTIDYDALLELSPDIQQQMDVKVTEMAQEIGIATDEYTRTIAQGSAYVASNLENKVGNEGPQISEGLQYLTEKTSLYEKNLTKDVLPEVVTEPVVATVMGTDPVTEMPVPIDTEVVGQKTMVDDQKLNLLSSIEPGADLAEANLSRMDLTNANLAGANLSKANLANTNLTDANLSGADLFGANLLRANVTRTNFADANLNNADFTSANISETNFDGASLVQTEFRMTDYMVNPNGIIPTVIKIDNIDTGRFPEQAANLDPAQNLKQSINQGAKQVATTAKASAETLSLAAKNMETFAKNIKHKGFKAWAIEKIPVLKEKAAELVANAGQHIKEQAPVVKDAVIAGATRAGQEISQFAKEQAPVVKEAAIKAGQAVSQYAKEQGPVVADALFNVVEKIAQRVDPQQIEQFGQKILDKDNTFEGRDFNFSRSQDGSVNIQLKNGTPVFSNGKLNQSLDGSHVWKLNAAADKVAPKPQEAKRKVAVA